MTSSADSKKPSHIKAAWQSAHNAVAFAVLVGILIAFGYLFWFGYHRLNVPEQTYVIKPGTSLRAFSRDMYAKGVLPDSRTLVVWAYIEGVARDLKAGEYRFAHGITPLEMLHEVTSGHVISYPLAIIEGWTFRQVREALDAAPKLEHTLKGLDDEQIMARLGHPGVFPEGRFYPDTYDYTAGTPDIAILRNAYDKMAKLLNQAWQNRDPDLPLKNETDALTLASIVEKESALPAEQRLIAGVFVNRLRRGMRLQTDPTVIYGMGAAFDGNLRLADLHRDTPYNTYTRAGLPPTPIAMPGEGAIEAAVHPAKTDDLYFVSRGDGSHQFSKTLAEHNQAVIKYQLHGHPHSFSSDPNPTPAATDKTTGKGTSQ